MIRVRQMAVGVYCGRPIPSRQPPIAGKQFLVSLLLLVLLLYSLTIHASNETVELYDVQYEIKLVPKKDYALVLIRIEDASLLKKMIFRLDPDRHSHVKANGKLKLRNSSAIWSPPKRNAKFQLRAKITHERSKGKFDAIMTDDWAIFRGDDLVPPLKVKAKRGASAKGYLTFILPMGWHTVNTGWERDKSVLPKGQQKNAPQFFIDNPERRFDRPTGWMIAGKVGTRREWVGKTRISVSAPNDSSFHRMDILTYLGFVWPELEKAFVVGPDKLLIVGGDDPMWRGGLSASNSLFLHADRPLVSENGTSALLHEVVHMFTRIRGVPPDDWIAEGLAEFYSIELLHRAGGISKERRGIVRQKLSDWSKGVDKLRIGRSSGAVTARAALLFYELDEEIRCKTNGVRSIDDLTRKLIEQRKVSFEDLSKLCYQVTGSACEALKDSYYSERLIGDMSEVFAHQTASRCGRRQRRDVTY